MVLLSKPDLLAAWRALDQIEIGDGQHGWQGIPLLTHCGCAIYAGRHVPDNEEMLVVSFTRLTLYTHAQLPSGKGFRFEFTRSQEDRINGLIIRRQQSGNRDVFTTMVLDIINTLIASDVVESSQQLALLLKRIRIWQTFMERDFRALSEQEEIGLFGELTCLLQLLTIHMDAVEATRAWVGPLHGVQDFESGNMALEVKSTLADTGFCITVHSLEQFDSQRLDSLILCGYRFSEQLSGMTLNQMVAQVRAELAGMPLAQCFFEGTLCHAGYMDEQAVCYTRKFVRVAGYSWAIDDKFPVLTHANVPPSVINARYQIELQPLLSCSQDLSKNLTLFAGAANGTA